MNGTGMKLKDKSKQSNCREVFSFIVGSFVFFISFEACKSMSAKCAIEKLQKVAKEKET
jgi:hypothetical protein